MSPMEKKEIRLDFRKRFRKKLALQFVRTVVIHLLCIFLYCHIYQGGFLFFFPPLFLSWVLVAVLMSTLHVLIHEKVLKHYFQEDFLVQIWLNPLLFFAFFLVLILGTFGLSDWLGYPGIFRQWLQLPLDLFTRFLYIFFLMIFSSGTYLFVELSVTWAPKFREFHFSSMSRKMARKALVSLSILALGGILYIPLYQESNLSYLRGLMIINLKGDAKNAIVEFKKVSEEEEQLYINSRYRIARIHQNLYRKYEDALKYFALVVEKPDSALRDDAIYQSLLCMSLSNFSGKNMLEYFESKQKEPSCLWDESYLLIASRFIQEENWKEAFKIYEELLKASPWRYSLKSFTNSRRRSFESTIELVEENVLKLQTMSGIYDQT